ncbi:hypothetical protein [Listeria monocytogenes]|uniref:hypothetical protein n=1 Tax=Listeria monocytogenes TaxID=1639 RepID=UPI000D729809|nr:hypothetical protein [Listeria monocytogenes]PXD11352.1 hypothetical protein C9852_04210 [Listeria monocytogenes]
MKKFIVIPFLLAFCIILGDNTNAKAEENILEIPKVEVTEAESGEMDINDLPKEVEDYFRSQGFDESNDIYYSTQLVSEPETAQDKEVTNNGLLKLPRLNAIRLFTATKKSNATNAYTSYTITASRAGFMKLDSRLYYGTNYKDSQVTPYKAPKVYNGGFYLSYTGKKKYLPCKVSTQYYTSMGIGTITKTAGGVTLGK